MATGSDFGDHFNEYPYDLPFVAPWDALQIGPAPILPSAFPDFTYPYEFCPAFSDLTCPYDFFLAFPDLTHPYEPFLAFPNLTYPYELFPGFPDLAHPYELFENPHDIRLDEEIEMALNPSFLPCYDPDPVPSSSSPKTSPPASDPARPCTTHPVPIPLSSPPAPSQNATGYPSNWCKIPQTVYGWGKSRWDYRPSQPILFHVNGLPGVNMGDALRNIFTGLDGRDDPMFQGGPDAFSCRLKFPGYPVNSKPQIFTKHWDNNCTPIARSTLVHHIAKKLEHYLDSMASSHSIDNSTDKQWEIGKGCMTIDNMFLVRLEHVTKGSYQPEIWVENRAV